jgi:hypothetical protein
MRKKDGKIYQILLKKLKTHRKNLHFLIFIIPKQNLKIYLFISNTAAPGTYELLFSQFFLNNSAFENDPSDLVLR